MFSIDLSHFEHLPKNKIVDFQNRIKFSRFSTYTKDDVFKFETQKDYGKIAALFVKEDSTYKLHELHKNGETVFRMHKSKRKPDISPERLFNLFKIEEIKSDSLIKSNTKKSNLLKLFRLK